MQVKENTGQQEGGKVLKPLVKRSLAFVTLGEVGLKGYKQAVLR